MMFSDHQTMQQGKKHSGGPSPVLDFVPVTVPCFFQPMASVACASLAPPAAAKALNASS
jgi:hypothetical protein